MFQMCDNEDIDLDTSVDEDSDVMDCEDDEYSSDDDSEDSTHW